MDEPDLDTLWYQPNLDVFLNRWFSNYADARQSLEDDGGFLLPYKHHFYVCEADVISALGLDSDDPDWVLVGRDCAKPLDMHACLRLQAKRLKAIQSK